MKQQKSLFFLLINLTFFSFSFAQPCFLPRVDYTFPGTPGNVYRPVSITAADFNGDGKQDVAVANYAMAYGISAFMGTGTGSFSPTGASYTLGYVPEAVVSADFNSDGKIDLAAIGSSTATAIRISILNGVGTGSFTVGTSYTLAADVSMGGWVLNTGDYNGDGKKDLCYLKTGSPTSTVTCLLGNGLGSFPTVSTYTYSGIYSRMRTSDFNNDGKSDIAFNSTSSVLQIKFGAPTGLAAATSSYTSIGSGWLAAGDFNGDSNEDLGVISSNTLKILLGSPTGTFSAATTYSMGASMSYITTGDYDLDGYDDLAMQTSSGTLVTLLGSITGTLSQGLQYSSIGDRDIITSEFTSDGKPDIVTVTYGSDNISILKSGIQPLSATSGTICSGKSYTINPTGAVSYSFSAGAAIVSPTASTSYTINGQFAEGCDNSTTCSVTVLPLPTITVNNGTVCTGFSHTITPTGANTYTYSNGIVVSPVANSTYTVSGTGLNGCVNSSTLSVVVIPIQTPSICLITLDSIISNNEIYWEKSLYTNVDSFIIHREVSTNIYKRIGAVSVNAYSMYLDTNRSIGPANGNPNFTAYKYKIQIRNTCGTYGALSLWHQTIFVQDQQNGNFNWNAYAIESSSPPVSNYDLKRYDVATGGETLVGSTTSNLFTDPQYSSFWPTSTKWFVDAVGFNCNPTLKIANPNGSLAQKVKTKSNHANDRIGATKTNSINSFNSGSVVIYPNPSKEKLNIEIGFINENITIELNNVLGQTITKIPANEKNVTINTSTYESGIYFLNIKINDKIISVKKVVIE